MRETTLFVANDGGHFMQLASLAPRLSFDEVVWVTVPTPQTETMLEGESVEWAHPAPTRDALAVVRNTAFMRQVIARHEPAKIVSTGASLALSSLPIGALHGASTHYVESVTRADNFSMSGRILRRMPRVEMYTQWPHLADEHWKFRGSVLDGFTACERPDPKVNRIVVSVGTSQKFGFRRLLERLVHVIPTDIEVLWQTGSTDTSGLGIDAQPSVPGDKLAQAISEADVLISHAGAGISLSGVSNGKFPLLVPRRAERDEHIDNHQQQIARHLDEMGLAMVRPVEDLTWADIEHASGYEAHQDADVAPFVLE